MAKISTYRNALVDIANRYNAIGWVCDLICLAIQCDGKFRDTDYNDIKESLIHSLPARFTPPSHAREEIVPEIRLLSLKHNEGVGALAPNQSIKFCTDNLTLIYGLNGSGKTSYFKILNNLVSGKRHYTLRNNIYSPAPTQSVELRYSLDGNEETFTWDTKTPTKSELQYVRVFDGNYAKDLLQLQADGDYVFHSYTLGIYRGILQVVNRLKEDGEVIEPIIEEELNGLCNGHYQQVLIDTLTALYLKEKEFFGLLDVDVSLSIEDIMKEPTLLLHIQNSMYPEEILSEGELKGVALALFFAECELQSVKTPIIFDDPVNSLDSRIMYKFIERLSQLKQPVILFTHNQQLYEMIKENNKLFRIYSNTLTSFATPRSFVPTYVYKLSYETKGKTGVVTEYKDYIAEKYLDKADSILSSTGHYDEAIPYLRLTIENMVDEIVFRKQSPLKYRGRSNIQWEEYRKIIALPVSVIDDLETMYGELSGRGGLHVGLMGAIAPLTKTEVTKYLTDLSLILSTYA